MEGIMPEQKVEQKFELELDGRTLYHNNSEWQIRETSQLPRSLFYDLIAKFKQAHVNRCRGRSKLNAVEKAVPLIAAAWGCKFRLFRKAQIFVLRLDGKSLLAVHYYLDPEEKPGLKKLLRQKSLLRCTLALQKGKFHLQPQKTHPLVIVE
jgi:hypothetical protein